MSDQTLALRAPEYIKIAASLIAAHGWCNTGAGPLVGGTPKGLNLVRAVVWAVADRQCSPRDLSDAEATLVDEVLDHLEGAMGLDMPVSEYERQFANASAQNIAWELTITAWRYESLIAPSRVTVGASRTLK